MLLQHLLLRQLNSPAAYSDTRVYDAPPTRALKKQTCDCCSYECLILQKLATTYSRVYLLSFLSFSIALNDAFHFIDLAGHATASTVLLTL